MPNKEMSDKNQYRITLRNGFSFIASYQTDEEARIRCQYLGSNVHVELLEPYRRLSNV
jgi:hypothetical protein